VASAHASVHKSLAELRDVAPEYVGVYAGRGNLPLGPPRRAPYLVGDITHDEGGGRRLLVDVEAAVDGERSVIGASGAGNCPKTEAHAVSVGRPQRVAKSAPAAGRAGVAPEERGVLHLSTDEAACNALEWLEVLGALNDALLVAAMRRSNERVL